MCVCNRKTHIACDYHSISNPEKMKESTKEKPDSLQLRKYFIQTEKKYIKILKNCTLDV